jgi:hypothetical protein
MNPFSGNAAIKGDAFHTRETTTINTVARTR